MSGGIGRERSHDKSSERFPEFSTTARSKTFQEDAIERIIQTPDTPLTAAKVERE